MSTETIAGPRKAEGAMPVADASGIYTIWPDDGTAPGSGDWTHEERTIPAPWHPDKPQMTRNVVKPSVTVFQPAPGSANGSAMVVAPGGAFNFLMMEHEGYDFARWLTARGVTAFVLKYRLARTPDADSELEAFRAELGKKLGQAKRDDTDPPARNFGGIRDLADEDGRQAIRFVRQYAARWGVDPGRVGIAGFSAGGGVAMGAMFQHDAGCRPDFGASIYSAYRRGGTAPDNPPPLFIVIADDDPVIPPMSSARLYEAWHKAGAPVELHIYGTGGHGFGMSAKSMLSDHWLSTFENWLAGQGVV